MLYDEAIVLSTLDLSVHFATVPPCDRQTDRQTDNPTVTSTALCWLDVKTGVRSKNFLKCRVKVKQCNAVDRFGLADWTRRWLVMSDRWVTRAPRCWHRWRSFAHCRGVRDFRRRLHFFSNRGIDCRQDNYTGWAQTVLGVLIDISPSCKFPIVYICAKNYVSWLSVDKVI